MGGNDSEFMLVGEFGMGNSKKNNLYFAEVWNLPLPTFVRWGQDSHHDIIGGSSTVVQSPKDRGGLETEARFIVGESRIEPQESQGANLSARHFGITIFCLPGTLKPTASWNTPENGTVGRRLFSFGAFSGTNCSFQGVYIKYLFMVDQIILHIIPFFYPL